MRQLWDVSASWNVPSDAVSGVYFAKLVREDGQGGASHVVFVVRDDNGGSNMLFQTSDTTWQAYNSYGGNSLYTGSPDGRAYKVSYNRPFSTRGNEGGEDWVFNAEYPMIRWMEHNGYDVSYFTGLDSDRYGDEIMDPRYLSLLRRSRRVLVRHAAPERRGRPRRGREPRLLQRERVVLEDPLGAEHRLLRHPAPHPRLLQGRPTPTTR